MPDVPQGVTDPALRERLTEIQDRLARQLAAVDPHRLLHGRPVSYHVIGGQTFEITYLDVPRIDEALVLAVKRVIGEECFCSVAPATAETLTVCFVIPLQGASRH